MHTWKVAFWKMTLWRAISRGNLWLSSWLFGSWQSWRRCSGSHGFKNGLLKDNPLYCLSPLNDYILSAIRVVVPGVLLDMLLLFPHHNPKLQSLMPNWLLKLWFYIQPFLLEFQLQLPTSGFQCGEKGQLKLAAISILLLGLLPVVIVHGQNNSQMLH